MTYSYDSRLYLDTHARSCVQYDLRFIDDDDGHRIVRMILLIPHSYWWYVPLRNMTLKRHFGVVEHLDRYVSRTVFQGVPAASSLSSYPKMVSYTVKCGTE